MTGHVSLLDEGRRRGDVLVLSIFVNPTQFGPKEDLSRYPRDLDGDLAKAERAGVDVAYVPDAAAMYPPGYQTYVEVEELQKGLCGASRPGTLSRRRHRRAQALPRRAAARRAVRSRRTTSSCRC